MEERIHGPAEQGSRFLRLAEEQSIRKDYLLQEVVDFFLGGPLAPQATCRRTSVEEHAPLLPPFAQLILCQARVAEGWEAEQRDLLCGLVELEMAGKGIRPLELQARQRMKGVGIECLWLELDLLLKGMQDIRLIGETQILGREKYTKSHEKFADRLVSTHTYVLG